MLFPRIALFVLALASAGLAQNATQDARAASGDSNERLYQSFQMGVLAIQNREWDDAVSSLNEAVRLDPSRSAAWARLGEAYFGMARSQRGAESLSAFRKSVDAYSHALEKDADNAAYHNGYGLALAGAGRYGELSFEMEKAAALDPSKAAQYYYSFGVLLLNAGHPDPAAAALEKAARAAPGISEIYFQYGSALASQARVTEDGKAAMPAAAIDAFHGYLQTAPTGPYSSVVKEALAFDGSTVPTSYGEPLADAPGAPRALSVGGSVQASKLNTKAVPAYPLLARRLRVAGTVSLNALIGEDGAVVGLTLDNGNPLLAAAAMDAVKKFTYKPTLLNDKPVRVRTRIDVTFTPGAQAARAGQ